MYWLKGTGSNKLFFALKYIELLLSVIRPSSTGPVPLRLKKTYQAVDSFRLVYYRSDLAFSGHLVVLSVFDPSIGMVPAILKNQYAKHPLKSWLIWMDLLKIR